jgi:hypothetical protein
MQLDKIQALKKKKDGSHRPFHGQNVTNYSQRFAFYSE